ncbi:MAG: hypothetical protein WDN75_03285 [Bacteroidota bacterium]
MPFFAGLISLSSLAQGEKGYDHNPDLQLRVQIETTEALNDLYNFKFEKAEQQFRWFKQRYAWHPLPLFFCWPE